jgi:hypothetical protein
MYVVPFNIPDGKLLIRFDELDELDELDDLHFFFL